MDRAVIIVKGRVQRAGYRDFVDEAAFNLDLAGSVKNLEDGSVEVVCEGSKNKIQEFVKKIQIKQYPIKVESIDVKFSKAKGEFKAFEIVRDEDLTTAIYDRMDTAARYMREMNNDLGEKIDSGNKVLVETITSGNKCLGEKIDSGNKVLAERMEDVGSGLGSFHDDTAKRFDTLDIKYGAISENMRCLMEKMDRNAEQTEKTIEALVEQQKEFNSSVKGLTAAILKLAEKRT
ncbi:MAG: acylphosphatase [Candidatus Altiarchaeia archaeon]